MRNHTVQPEQLPVLSAQEMFCRGHVTGRYVPHEWDYVICSKKWFAVRGFLNIKNFSNNFFFLKNDTTHTDTPV